MSTTFNVYEISSYANPRGNYGRMVNSFKSEADAVKFACDQFRACKGEFAVGTGLVTVFDTRNNHGDGGEL